jgi:hypothetical protein
VFPLILTMTPQMLQHADWKYRHAALMAISATGEGCHKQMESYLAQIMDGVMNFVNDPVIILFIDIIDESKFYDWLLFKKAH